MQFKLIIPPPPLYANMYIWKSFYILRKMVIVQV